jgi:hypothetical protein
MHEQMEGTELQGTSKDLCTPFPELPLKAGSDPEDPLWQVRYYGFNIYSERKLREKVEYMHNHPVRAGLVREQTDWPWSSARFWSFGKSVGLPISWPP